MNRYSFPKVELHLHLDGSVLPETAWDLANAQGIALPADTLEEFRHFIVVTSNCRSVNEYLARFEVPLQILQDRESLIRVTAELIGLLSSQGVAYAEIRFAPQLHTRGQLSQKEAVEAVLEGRRRGLKACPGIRIGILLCAMSVGPETLNMDVNLETVRLVAEYLGKGVVGVDLAGAEGIVPLSNFHPIFDLAKELQLPRICHAGDSQGPDTVRDAISFGISRIGHGHHIVYDEELCRIAVQKQIALEICPTSNVQCQTVPSYEEHPAKKLLDMGIPVTINTDNMILAGICLEDEYDHCIKEMGFTYADLIQMNINAVRASFMPEAEKQPLIDRLQQHL